MRLTSTPAGRRLLVAAAAVMTTLVLAVMVSAVIIRSQDRPTHSAASGDGSVPAASATPDVTDSGSGAGLTSAESAAVKQDVSALAAMPVVRAGISRSYPRISDTPRAQADDYAAAFATELLTQNYRMPREQLLGWIQSEAATSAEPSVVGLVPAPLRPRLAVFSLTTPSVDGTDQRPVPSASDWAKWAAVGGYSTATITKVSEPQSWTDAVRAGRLTDPGITARSVDAVITTHWTQHGATKTARKEATLVMTLEGPPTREAFGFVCAVTYHEMAVR